MSESNWKHRANAAAYVGLYPFLRDVAKLNGYALGVHGSLANDFDLIAVPWVENAVSADKLITELAEVVGGEIPEIQQPGIKPHGRLAWTVHLGADRTWTSALCQHVQIQDTTGKGINWIYMN